MVRHTYWMEVLSAAGIALSFYFAVSATIDGAPLFVWLQGFLVGVNYRTFKKQAVVRQRIAELDAQEKRLRELIGR